jgi:hypothetical protein
VESVESVVSGSAVRHIAVVGEFEVNGRRGGRPSPAAGLVRDIQAKEVCAG